MGKLVRDKIPDLIRKSGLIPEVRVLDTEAYLTALHDKLPEEAAELRSAPTPATALAEIAGVLEVLTTIAALHGASLQDIVDLAETTRAERGGFANRLWLENADSHLNRQTID
jgi:predicted house-cleaning noncanonical NTP pyrophosphatase (MazG superfamily)